MKLSIIRDSREQYTPEFSDDVVLCGAKLEFGDYSAVGLTDRLALELKWSLDDLVTCVTRDRDRFDTMLRGLARYEYRALIIGASIGDVTSHRYVSQTDPKSVIGSVWAWAMDYQIPCIWAKDRRGATRTIEWWARRAVAKTPPRKMTTMERALAAEPDLTGTEWDTGAQ